MLAVSFAVTLGGLWLDWQAGGHAWQQADWLIHADAGPVRRGLFGSAMLWLAALSGLSPVTVVIMVQGALVIALYAVTCVLLRDRRLGWIAPVIAFSPLFFAVFWAQDPDGGLRKDLWAFLALLILAAGGAPWRMWLAGALFVCGLAGHEALILFLPAMIALAALTQRRRAALGFAAVLALLGAGLMLWHLRFPVGDAAAICAALAGPDLPQGFCDGAIRWVGAAPEAHLTRPAQRLSPSNLGQLAISLGAALVPLVLLCAVGTVRTRRILMAVLVLSALPYLPLYLVAIDWGRWMSFHIVTVAALMIALVRTGRLSPPATYRAPLIALCAPIVVAPHHYIGVNPDAWVFALLGVVLCLAALAWHAAKRRADPA
ncbi:hypothetical protein ACP2AV_14280 [Aliiroseovarius sp. PTFE2010]|uniref:hypothetical protein n=1 Tax=Aliiroseovarius sp. PTFE2010 TaxID=3417190 RepID=UPI003CF6ED3E